MKRSSLYTFISFGLGSKILIPPARKKKNPVRMKFGYDNMKTESQRERKPSEYSPHAATMFKSVFYYLG